LRRDMASMSSAHNSTRALTRRSSA
jgi:hypothetical protein